jgi:hypothetical protein
MKDQKLMAFWKHHDGDNYKYLHGEVVRFTPEGFVETKEYGGGRYFLPVMILPYDEGEKVEQLLDEAEYLYRAGQEKLKREYYANISNNTRLPDLTPEKYRVEGDIS